MSYAGRWIIITGVRDIDIDGLPLVAEKMRAIVDDGPAGIVFGGARGVDTAALRYASRWRGSFRSTVLLAVVPGKVDEQPRACAKAIRECADEIVECGLPLDNVRSYGERNGRMLLEAVLRGDGATPICVAFPSHDVGGGTRDCMKRAALQGIEVETIHVPTTVGGKD